jgi:hypothetical protein
MHVPSVYMRLATLLLLFVSMGTYRSYECIFLCLGAVSYDVHIPYIYVLLATMPTFPMSMCG